MAASLASLALAAAWPGNAGAHDNQVHHQDKAPGYVRVMASYQVPDALLVRSDWRVVHLSDVLNSGKPVILNFVYSTCTTSCPVLSHTFTEFQDLLGAEQKNVQMISITIDPGEDTPDRLADYGRRHSAGSQWGFYTGTPGACAQVQRAFQASFGGKMHHRPLTFMRAAPGRPWLRIEGYPTPSELLKEYRELTAGGQRRQ
jgi:protein SCO1/2